MMLRIRDLLLRCPRGLSFAYERITANVQCNRRCASDAVSYTHCSGVGNRQYATLSAAEPFMNGSSSAYIEDMFEAWQKDPSSVHKVGTIHAILMLLKTLLRCRNFS